MNSLSLARAVVQVLEDKKGENILLLDIREQTVFTEYFVICTATSDRMLNALLEAVADEIKAAHGVRPRTEGQPEAGWVLADYGDVVVHLFSPQQRNYYRLEELWSQGRVLLRVQ